MCDPFTVMAIGTTALSAVSNIAGIGTGMAAAKSGAEFGKASADVDAAVAGFNADLLHREAGVQRAGADLPLAAGALAETRLRRTVDATLGTQAARFAAAGVDAAEGAPLLAQMFTAQQGELDAGIIRARAQRERANILIQAANTDVQATNAEYQGMAAQLKGQYAIATGQYQAASALIGGVSKWPGIISGGAKAFGFGGGGGGGDVTG